MKTTDAVRYFGTKSELARSLGITKQSITSWGETVPLARQYQLERITGGFLKAPAVPEYRGKQTAA